MRLLREEGRLKEFTDREKNLRRFKQDDMLEWEYLINKSKDLKDKLTKHQPDIISRINEKNREKVEKERERREEEERRFKEGEWIYNPANDDYWWSGENEPPEEIECVDNQRDLTEEEERQIKEQEERWIEAIKQEERERRNKKDRERRAASKKAMQKPIDALPDRELCQYEKIRESIIKERNEAMAKCKFFEELNEAKENMTEKQSKKNDSNNCRNCKL